MLGILEKIVWGLSIAAIVLFAAAWHFLGGPSTVPRIALKKLTAQTGAQARSGMTPEENQKLEEHIKSGKAGSDKKGDGRKPPGKSAPLKESKFDVPREYLDHVDTYTKAFNEAKRARSKSTGDGGLQIYDFDEGSLPYALGFEPNDVIYDIYFDGSPKVDFATGEGARELYEVAIERLRAGESVWVQIARRGKPELLRFTPDKTR
ncbi:MAG: hypothetical protein L0Z55_09765 [Planctomycetes bacterium]|nr:hypothetical protein [Planctomycetota bacterium]